MARRLRSDPLLQNSLYLMLATATMGVLGFLFWVLSARLFTPGQIGIATTLISATSLISYLSLLGFNSTFIRSLPTSTDRDAEINAGLLMVFGAAVIVALAYAMIVPSLVPRLELLRASRLYAFGFVILTALSAVNLLTDSVFIAYRAAKFNLLVDGVIQGLTKLALPVVFVGLGAYGVFAASGVASGIGVVASLIFMARAFGYRPELRIRTAILRQSLTYSAANYLASILNIVPILVLPLIVIDGRGAAEAAYYFVAFQIANLVYSVGYAVSQSLFAEGSYADADLKALRRRSGKVLAASSVPAVVFVTGASRWLLLIFGGSYSRHGSATLAVFGLAIPAVALNTWTASMLKLTRQLSALIWCNVLYAVVIGVLAALWVHWGLPWVAMAWLVGNVAAGGAGMLALLRPARPRGALAAGIHPCG